MQPPRACWGAILVLAAVACASCASKRPVERLSTFDAAPLYGMVYDHDNLPCAGACLLLDGRARAVADRDGRFAFSRVAPGEHRLLLTKEGYEALAVSIDFQDPSQVLYARMVSLEQLLADAERGISNGEWEQAASILRRASVVSEDDEAVELLRAILDYKRGVFTEAERRLRGLIDAAQDAPPPVLYLFLADLYERNLGRPALAADALEHYLRDSGDPNARTRLEHLQERLHELPNPSRSAESTPMPEGDEAPHEEAGMRRARGTPGTHGL